MTLPLSPGSTIGIVGGGQLGRMLAIAAARLGYRTVILEPQAGCPAAQVANRQIVAAYDNPSALEALAEVCEVVTYEFENIPLATAKKLAENVAVLPPPAALEAAQDRVVEKTFLRSAGVATANFVSVDSDTDLRRGLADFNGAGVLKTRRLGYDGKGQRVFRENERTEGAYADMGGVPLILEALVPFEFEISIIAARSRERRIVAFDPSENEHVGAMLHRSTVPGRIKAEAAKSAGDAASKVLEALDYVGVIGVEFFVLRSGELIANEIAPRVHNSGHWTEAACSLSQFEQHIRAVVGLPLGDPVRHSDCVMENLIGDEVWRAPQLLAVPQLVLHLYGKEEARTGRKMGHFTRLTGPARSG